jgi:hypothetical protein
VSANRIRPLHIRRRLNRNHIDAQLCRHSIVTNARRTDRQSA